MVSVPSMYAGIDLRISFSTLEAHSPENHKEAAVAARSHPVPLRTTVAVSFDDIDVGKLRSIKGIVRKTRPDLGLAHVPRPRCGPGPCAMRRGRLWADRCPCPASCGAFTPCSERPSAEELACWPPRPQLQREVSRRASLATRQKYD